MSDFARLRSLIANIEGFFRKDTRGNIIGVKLSKDDMNSAVAPNNIVIGDGVKKITASATAPVDPEPGDIWIDIS